MRDQLSHNYGNIAPREDAHVFSNSDLIDSDVETSVKVQQARGHIVMLAPRSW